VEIEGDVKDFGDLEPISSLMPFQNFLHVRSVKKNLNND